MKLRHTTLSIQSEKAWLDATLSHAPDVRGLIVLLNTTHATHADSRETLVTRTLQQAHYATLVVDLVHHHEDTRDADIRFNMPLLTTRVLQVMDWVRHQPALSPLPCAMLAAGNACGAAIRAGGQLEPGVLALVCRGGRPDLAGVSPLRRLATPCSFIVGDQDPHREALLNAYTHLTCPREWIALPSCGEFFLEPGQLDAASHHAMAWFDRHLLQTGLPTPPPEPA